jgi:hypothetical protein
LIEWEAYELIGHFSLLDPLNANDEEMGRKVDDDDDLGPVCLFHVNIGGVNINDFFVNKKKKAFSYYSQQKFRSNLA